MNNISLKDATNLAKLYSAIYPPAGVVGVTAGWKEGTVKVHLTTTSDATGGPVEIDPASVISRAIDKANHLLILANELKTSLGLP